MKKVNKFNQKEWLKPCTDNNTKLRQDAKNNFEKVLFNLMNNAVFGNIEISNLSEQKEEETI